MVDVVCDVLGIGEDAAYRRISGKTALSLEEGVKLCSHFGISIDEEFNPSQINNVVICKYSEINVADWDSFTHFFDMLRGNYKRISLHEDAEIFHVAQGIPLHHYLKYPELLFFKPFVWNGIMQNRANSFEQFYKTLDKSKIMTAFDIIRGYSKKIQRTEVWSSVTIDPVLSLIEHYMKLGAFEKEDTIRLLISQLLHLVEDLERETEWIAIGKNQSKTSLYISKVNMKNELILIREGENLSVTFNLLTINNITSNNKVLCKESKRWIDDLIYKSVLITGSSIIERRCFFAEMKQKIENYSAKLVPRQ
jgi:hypothetical protein